MVKLALRAGYLLVLVLACTIAFVAGRWRQSYVHARVDLLVALMTEAKLAEQKVEAARGDNRIRAKAAYMTIESLPRWITFPAGSKSVSRERQAERAANLGEILRATGDEVPPERLQAFVAQHFSRTEVLHVTVP